MYLSPVLATVVTVNVNSFFSCSLILMINPPSTTMHTIAWRLQSIAAPSLTTASYAARAQVILLRPDFSGLRRGQWERLTETKVVLGSS